MRVEMSPGVLEWVIQYSQKSQVEFNRRFPKFPSWIKGDECPTVKQLEALAAFANIPFGYLLLPNRPNIAVKKINDFRTKDSQRKVPDEYSPELRDSISIIRERQDWLRDYKKNQGYRPVAFIRSVSKQIVDLELVEKINIVFHINKNWQEVVANKEGAFHYFLEKIENAGVSVFINGTVGTNTHRKLNVDEFRGFALADRYAPVIFINGVDATAGRLFTLVHELVHLFLGQDGLDDGTEVFCNRIAAKVLVPLEVFHKKWNVYKGDFLQLEHFFKVSLLVLYRVALDSGKISREEWISLMNEYNQKQRNLKQQSSGGNFYNAIPYKIGKGFSRYVFESVKEGTTLYKEAYRLLGIKGDTFATVMKRVEGWN